MAAVPPSNARIQVSKLLADHSSVFRYTFISTSVLNSIFTATAIFGNSLVLIAILKSLSIRKPQYALLVCLAVSDLGVGLLCHPLYVAWKVDWLVNGWSVKYFQMSKAVNIISTYFASVSFLTVTIVICERYLALHYHLRYESMVTIKKLIFVVLSPWAFTALLAVLNFFFKEVNFYAQITLMPICLLTTTVAYLRTYFILRRHHNQIKCQEQAVSHAARQDAVGNEFDFQNFRKSAINMFFVYVLQLVCYLPYFIVVMLFKNEYTAAIGIARNFTMTGVYLNSSLNPILYCWRLAVIRHAIKKLLSCKKKTQN